jgi:hypothetical protein
LALGLSLLGFFLPGFFLLQESLPLSSVQDEAFLVVTLPWLGIWCAGLAHQTCDVQLSAGVVIPAAWTGSGGTEAFENISGSPDEGASVGTAEPVLGSVEPESLKIGGVSSADRVYSAASVLDEEFLVD